MCIASKKVGPRCPNVCQNENPSLGCFNETNPPTCNPRSTNFAIKYDIQETCYRLLWDYLYTPQVIFDLSSHEKVLSAIHKDSTLCDAAQQAYHLCYWCDPKQKNLTDDFCSFDCSSTAQVFDQTVNVDVICNELTRLRGIDEWPASIELCHGLQLAGHLCENLCENFDASFIKVSDPKSMSILSRVAAILSFLGASFILWDVLSDAKNRSTVYHQLLVAMAIFDIVTAVAWFFSGCPFQRRCLFMWREPWAQNLLAKFRHFLCSLDLLLCYTMCHWLRTMSWSFAIAGARVTSKRDDCSCMDAHWLWVLGLHLGVYLFMAGTCMGVIYYRRILASYGKFLYLL